MAEMWRKNGAKVAYTALAISAIVLLIKVSNPSNSSAKVGVCYSDEPEGVLYSTIVKVHSVSTLSSDIKAIVGYEAFVYQVGTAGLARHAYVLEPSESIWVKEPSWGFSPKEFREDFEFEVPCLQFDTVEALVELHEHARLMENDVRRLMRILELNDAQ